MKITESELKRLIKEEVQKLITDGEDPATSDIAGMEDSSSEEQPIDTPEKPAPTKVVGFKTIFGEQDKEGLSPRMTPYFKAAAVLAKFLGELGDYKGFEAHDDIRVEAIEYFTKLEKLKQKFMTDEVFGSPEGRRNIQSKALNLLNQYHKIQPYFESALELYNQFLQEGMPFLREYVALYNRPELKTKNIYHTDGHAIRVRTAATDLAGGVALEGLKSMGILMRDFLAYTNGHDIDYLQRKRENGMIGAAAKPSDEESFETNPELAAENEPLNAVTQIVNDCVQEISQAISRADGQQDRQEIYDIFMNAINKYASENMLDRRRLAPCVQKMLLGDEAGARKYLMDLAKGYKVVKGFKGGRIA
jgi:hypothetical protein